MAQLMKIMLLIVAIAIWSLIVAIVRNLYKIFQSRKKMQQIEQDANFQKWLFRLCSFEEEDQKR